MHAAPVRIEKRSLDMDAEHAWHAAVDRRAHRRDTARDDIEIVADEGGQESRGTEAPVRAADGADGLDRRIVVEQHATTAIDLHVDESRREQLSLQIDHAIDAGELPGAGDGLDASVANQQRAIVFDARDGQQFSIDERQQHQTVSVTL